MTSISSKIGASSVSRAEAASNWLVRNGSGEDLTPSELQEWEVWIGDPDNSAEYDELMRMRWELNQLPKTARPAAAELASSSPADLGFSRRISEKARSPAKSPAHGWRFRLAIAACVGAFVVFLAARFNLLPGGFALDSGHTYLTVAGEQREFKLVDGSVITLGGSSSVTVTFSPIRRTVFLERGEARFRVQHDSFRPFTVFAGMGSVTAVGTVFNVHRYSSRVFVSVSEGVVQVAAQATPPSNSLSTSKVEPSQARWAPVRVARGQEVAYDSNGQTAKARPVDQLLYSAWTDGSLVYRGRPLSEVIEDVQRYSNRRIVLDPSAGGYLYTGTFLESDVDQWLGGLPQIFPVDVSHSNDLVIIRSNGRSQ